MKLLVNIVKNLFRRPATRRYPFDKRASFELSRGHVEIEIEKCIFCGLCSRKCPADALLVEKPQKAWTIDPYKCVLCAACIEACPKKCLFMRTEPSYPIFLPDARSRHRTFHS